MNLLIVIHTFIKTSLRCLDKICFDQVNNDIGVDMATKQCHYLFYLQPYFLALGNLLPKGTFSSNTNPEVREV